MQAWLYSIIIYPIIFVFPAWAANAAPVIFGGGAPIDFHRRIKGRRIFGDHKTVRGTVFGLLAGFFIAFIEAQYLPFMLLTGVMLTLGTHFGDLFGSFVKRRLSIKEGQEFAVFDQYLFFIFALIFAFPFGNLPGIYGIIFIALLTGLLHVLTNRLAYMVKMKKVPW